jgi:hypothetical protein
MLVKHFKFYDDFVLQNSQINLIENKFRTNKTMVFVSGFQTLNKRNIKRVLRDIELIYFQINLERSKPWGPGRDFDSPNSIKLPD